MIAKARLSRRLKKNSGNTEKRETGKKFNKSAILIYCFTILKRTSKFSVCWKHERRDNTLAVQNNYLLRHIVFQYCSINLRV